MDAHALKKLREQMKREGLVQPIIWNRQTGNIVGGHQRVKVLDQLEKDQDYSLDVAVIDVPLEREKQINVFLNNPSAMGAWDQELLENLLVEMPEAAPLMGFDNIDLQWMFGGDLFAAGSEGETAEKTRNSIEAIKARKIESRGELRDKDDDEFYLVVVFEDKAQLNGFLRAIGAPFVTRYIDGVRLAQDLGLAIQGDQINPGATSPPDTTGEHEGA